MSSAFNVQLLLQTLQPSERQYLNQYYVVVRSTTTFPAHLRWSLPAPVPVCQAWLQRAASLLLEVHHRPEGGERKSSTRLVATRGSLLQFRRGLGYSNRGCLSSAEPMA